MHRGRLLVSGSANEGGRSRLPPAPEADPATYAEFEVDLLRMRTREGMAIARANGKLNGKAPKLNARQHTYLIKLYDAGEHSIAEVAELFSVGRATVHREIARAHTPAS